MFDFNVVGGGFRSFIIGLLTGVVVLDLSP